MTSNDANDSEWVKDLFAASACDWTPSSADIMRLTFYMRRFRATLRHQSVAGQFCRILNVSRADRFVTEESKTHFIQRRAFRRYCRSARRRSAWARCHGSILRRKRTVVLTFRISQISGLAFPPAGLVFWGRGRLRTRSVWTLKIKRETWSRENSLNTFFRKPRQKLLKAQAVKRAFELFSNSGVSRKLH